MHGMRKKEASELALSVSLGDCVLGDLQKMRDVCLEGKRMSLS